MVNKCIRCFIKVLFMAFLLTGCWDSEDIEKKNNISLVIVDFQEEQYRFYVEIANVYSGNAQSNKVGYSVLEAAGDSLVEARDELNRRCDFPIFLGATRAVVVTQRMAENGIEEYVNRLRADVEYRKSVSICTSPTEPLMIISDQPENDRSIGDAIQHTLDNQSKEGQTFTINVGDVLRTIALENVGFLIPQMSIDKGENTLTGYSVFKDARCIGTIPIKERKGIMYFLCSEPQFYYELYDEANHYIFEVVLKKKSIKAMFEEGQVTFKIDMSFEYKLHYMDKKTTVTEEQLKLLSQKLTEAVEEDLLATIKDSQNTYGCDYLGFYKYFRASYLSEFKKMNWEEKYKQAEMKLNVEATTITEP
ncbi:MAG: Ger(x)C family spore germination protein [Vallitaleaceae bacterium]|nr:Ger(x)C family spore germination protein [Vallitaleaceae bacterium]